MVKVKFRRDMYAAGFVIIFDRVSAQDDFFIRAGYCLCEFIISLMALTL